MPSTVAIRLAVEGGAEVKRSLQDAGLAGQQAFQQVGAAADAAGAATDRQTAKFQRLAQAAREAEAQARAQANINSLLGVGAGPSGSARDSASAFEAALDKQDQIDAARRAQAAQDAQASVNQILGIREAQAGAARASAGVSEEAYRQEAAALQRTADLRTAAIRNASSGWRDLSAAGAATLANVEASRKLGSLGMAPAANANDAGKRLSDEYRSRLITDIAFQGKDFFEQTITGGSPFRAALTQAPQVAALMSMGNLSVSETVGGLKDKVVGLAESAGTAVARVGLLGGTIGLVGTAAAAGVAALLSYRASEHEAEQQLLGAGRASGVTLTQLNALADAQARAGGMSRGTARSIAAGFAGTGTIGSDVIGGLLGTTRDFARITGRDSVEAAKDLAAAFADPVKGADELNQRLGFLNDTTRENVRRLAEQGDRLGAQRALLAAYRDGVSGAAEATQGWSRIGDNLANWFDHLGQSVSKGLFGGTLDQELAKAQERLSRSRVAAEGGFGLFSSKDVESAEKEVSRLSNLIEQRDSKIQAAQRGQRSLEVGGLIRSLLPDQQEVERLGNSVEKVRRAVAEPTKYNFDSASLATAEGALTRISRLWQTMAQDVAKYGSAQTAEMVRTAELNNRLVGSTTFGRSAAEVQFKFEQELRKNGLDPVETRRAAQAAQDDYSRRLNDPNIDANEGRALSAAREASQRNLRVLEGLERNRDLGLDSLRRSASITDVSGGGAFSRLSSGVQQQVQQAAEQFNRIPASIIAAIAERESGGNPNIGFSRSVGEDGRPSSSFGLGQINDATARAAVRGGYLPPGYDRTDTSTMAAGIAGVLSMKLDAAGGDLTKAIQNYFGSKDPTANQAYAADIYRRAGQLGDPSALAQTRNQDDATRALRDQNQALDRAKQFYGENGVALDAASEAQRRYNQLIDAGVQPSAALAASIKDLATRATEAVQATRLVQSLRDDDFARDQLGRDRLTQQAYAAARSRFGDTTSPEATALIGRTRETAALQEARSTFSDVFGTLVSDLRRGASAATIASDALGRFADKLVSNVVDKIAGNLFGAIGSSGSSAGLLSLLGFASGHIPGYADGVTPGLSSVGIISGPGTSTSDSILARVSTREAIIKASSVDHYGVGFIKAINDRTLSLPRFADGGPVGGYTMPSAAAMRPANAAAPQVVFAPNIIPPAGYEARTREVDDGQGGRKPEITFAEITARGIRSPQGQAALRQPTTARR